MNKDEALQRLKSPIARERLAGARYLARYPEQQDLEYVRAALRTENDHWVRLALRSALTTSTGDSYKDEVLASGAEDQEQRLIIDDTYAKALEETTKSLVHEIRPILGRIKSAARTENKDYEYSETKREIDQLTELMEAIDLLGRAAAPPDNTEFNLSDLIKSVTKSIGVGATARIYLAGPDALVVRGDKRLVELIFSNGLRNAIEAIPEQQLADVDSDVVVTWGSTERDFWLSIIDHGKGLPPGISEVFKSGFKLGVTNKNGHIGMGLALARRAEKSMEGKLSLTPREHVGAKFEYRWSVPAEAGKK